MNLDPVISNKMPLLMHVSATRCETNAELIVLHRFRLGAVKSFQ